MCFESASVLARIQLHSSTSVDLSPKEGGRALVIAEEGAARTALHEPVPVQKIGKSFRCRVTVPRPSA